MADLWQLDNGKTRQLIEALGLDTYWVQDWDENPITAAVKSDDGWDLLLSTADAVGYRVSGKGLAKSQVICQQLMWQGKGPEGDELPKTLRKLWYAGHKDALQHISKRLDIWRNGDQMNDIAANGTMSQVYGEFVDTKLVTYLDLYVKDGSRQFQTFSSWDRLPAPLSNIVFCIEKDAAYEDCTRIAKALGAAVALSGGGKMGKAGTENMVRKALSNYFETDTPGDRVTDDNPCYVLVISDWDYDGQAVIAPTFANQMRRYIPDHLLNWVRVGIKPAQVEDLGYTAESKAYQVKYHVNRAYSGWCLAKALFVDNQGEAHSLENLWEGLDWYKQDELLDRMFDALSAKAQDETTKDFWALSGEHDALKVLYEKFPPLGYELDALKRVEYATLIVEGLLTLITWDDLLDALSRKAWSDTERVVEEVTAGVLIDNEDYQDLSGHIEELRTKFEELIAKLEAKKHGFAADVENDVRPLVEGHAGDHGIKDLDRTPTKEGLADHLRLVQAWEHWQPYRQSDRNHRHQQIVEREESLTLNDLKDTEVEFERVEL